MIPKVDGDATPLGQRPLSVLPMVYRIWASARMVQPPDVHLFVADVVKSFDMVDKCVLDRVLCSLGLPGWFRHAYFEFHSHVRLRFKLATGLGQPWTRDGGIPQGCLFEHDVYCCFVSALGRSLSAQVGIQPQLYADNLKCVLGMLGWLVRSLLLVSVCL